MAKSYVQKKVYHDLVYSFVTRLKLKEQEKLLTKRLSDERHLRKEGKMAEMVALLTRIPQVIYRVVQNKVIR